MKYHTTHYDGCGCDDEHLQARVNKLERENEKLREAANAARVFLRVHYTMSNENANRISYEIDKQRQILDSLDLALGKAV